MEWGNQDGEQFGTNHSSGIQFSLFERDVENSKAISIYHLLLKSLYLGYCSQVLSKLLEFPQDSSKL